jgi:hypothetical protein
MKKEVEMEERKNPRGEEEVWEMEEGLGEMKSDADDGDSTKSVYGEKEEVWERERDGLR